MQEDNKDSTLQIHLLPHPDQNRQGQYVDVVKVKGSSPGEGLIEITTLINTECRWYTWLVLFEFVMSVLNMVISTFTTNEVQRGALMILLNIAVFLLMFVGFALALEEKWTLDKSTKSILCVLFMMMTIASFGYIAMIVAWTGWLLIMVIPLGIQGCIGLFLAFGSFFIGRLIRKRDKILKLSATEKKLMFHEGDISIDTMH